MKNRLFKNASPVLAFALGLGLQVVSTPSGAEYIKTFEGWRIYNSSCILCHGARGKGDGSLARKLGIKAADFRQRRQRLDSLSDRELRDEIKGTSGHFKDMPKWRGIYADPQLEAAVAYVRYLARSPYPLEGDPVEGQRYYQLYCVSCHGASGKGDGFMTSVLDIMPADHTSGARMDRVSNKEMTAIIKKGKSLMPAWDNILSDHEISELVSYIRLLSHPN